MMGNISYFNREEIVEIVRSKIKTVDIVLDVGCGILPQTFITPSIHLCCEPYVEYRDKLDDEIKKRISCLYLILPTDWRGAVEKIPPKSVDTIFLLDVVEHLDKNEGVELLKLTEKIARKQIVIYTPLGFMPQTHPDGIDIWGLHGGSWQEHKSGWMPDDFNEDWDFFICKDFHLTDNRGIVLDKPFGAFWAIKSFEETSDCDFNQNFDLLNIYNNFNFNDAFLVSNLIDRYNQLLKNSKTKIQELTIRNKDLNTQLVDLHCQHVELQREYIDLHGQHVELYNSTFSKIDRTLNRHRFIRLILRSIFRVIRFPFKIKQKIIK